MRRNPPIEFAKIDLRAKYDEFNGKYFGGRLPKDIVLKFGRMKGSSGQAFGRYVGLSPGEAVNSKRFGIPIPDAATKAKDLWIKMSTLLLYEDAEFDRYFLHEMIHIAMIVDGYGWEGHGRRFLRMAEEVGSAAGLQIPTKHILVGTEEVNAKARVLGALVIDSDGEKPPIYTLFNRTDVNFGVAKVLADRMVRDFRRPIRIYELATKAWAMTPVKRELPLRSVRMHYLGAIVARHLQLDPKAIVYEALPPA